MLFFAARKISPISCSSFVTYDTMYMMHAYGSKIGERLCLHSTQRVEFDGSYWCFCRRQCTMRLQPLMLVHNVVWYSWVVMFKSARMSSSVAVEESLRFLRADWTCVSMIARHSCTSRVFCSSLGSSVNIVWSDGGRGKLKQQQVLSLPLRQATECAWRCTLSTSKWSVSLSAGNCFINYYTLPSQFSSEPKTQTSTDLSTCNVHINKLNLHTVSSDVA